MPIKKWIFQYTTMLIVLFISLALVQYLKGRGLEYSIEFGVFWSFLATTMFQGARIYYYRKNIYCAVCNDLTGPDDGTINTDKET